MSDREGDEVGLDVAAAFGAEENASTQAFSVYVPNKDARGRRSGTSADGSWRLYHDHREEINAEITAGRAW
jgi:hypothetical protein